jgi:hypothetical protein
VVQGGKFFKDAIGEATKLTGEATHLARRLGITGEQASALNTALGDIYSDSETYIGAFDKFAKQLRTNESGLRDMGLQTRDANGHLRDSQELFMEALQLVGTYKSGLDQTTAAQELFGKGVDDVMKLQKLNNDVIDDAKKKNEELGLGLTQEGVEASKAYKAAMNDVGDVLTAVKVNIGNAVMPVFTEMGQYFASTGPYLIAVFKGALTGLLGAFEAIKATVKTVAGVIFEAINTIIDVGGLMGEVFSKLMRGDFSGAYEAAKSVGTRVAQAYQNAFANFMDAGNEAEAAMAAHMQRVWGKGTAVAAPKGGTKQQGEFKTEKDTKDPSQMAAFEEQLAREKVLASERDALHGMSKEAELQFWKDILATATLSEADKLSVSKKVSAARLDLLKQEAQQADQIGALALSAWQERELAKVNAAETEAQLQVQLGRSTQSELLAQQADFEQRKAEIRRTAIEASLAVLDPALDVVKVKQLQNELEKLELDHQAKLQQIRGQAAIEQNALWADLQTRTASLWDKGVTAMMNSTLTWRGATQAIMTEYGGWFAKQVIGEMVKKWLAGKAAQFAASMGFTTLEKTLQKAAAAETIATKTVEATAVVGANAAEAASGAAASQASIPYVGWALAGAAFAAVMAMVMSAKGSIKSARGGMDIPSGINPVTQLHEEEMVLPAHIAQPMREMLANGNQPAAMPAVTLNGTRMPGGFWMLHEEEFLKFHQGLKRDGKIR